MKRRSGKREGVTWKKSPALAKITREINQKQWRANHHYIYLEDSVFFRPGKRSVRREPSQTIRTLRHSCSVWSSGEDVNSEYQLFHIFRPAFDFYTGKKFSEYLDLFCRMNDMKLSRTMAYKTRKTVNRLERKQLHFYHVVPERPQEDKPTLATHRAREA